MASDFKARCLALIDRVAVDHVPVTITKRGRPVARLVAIEEEPIGRGTVGSVHLVADADEDYYSTGEDWGPIE
jgi:prevent-host-death family protein